MPELGRGFSGSSGRGSVSPSVCWAGPCRPARSCTIKAELWGWVRAPWVWPAPFPPGHKMKPQYIGIRRV